MRAAAVILLVAGCSSVPDVTFADGDAAIEAAVAAVDAGPHDSGVASVDAATGCPDHAPAGGICCGSRPCFRCNPSQCERCEQAGCRSPEVCCAKGMGGGNGVMSCTAATACN